MYGLEDGFEHVCGHLKLHWMWWPAIGGIGIGIGGFFFPRGLGVGYDNIAELLRGNAPVSMLVGLLVAKSLMWAFSLSSGTSGGVLAPLLMIGAASGESVARLAHMPGETQALWALMGMGAMLSGALGVPLTAIPILARTDPRSAGVTAADTRMYGIVPRYLAGHASIYSH